MMQDIFQCFHTKHLTTIYKYDNSNLKVLSFGSIPKKPQWNRTNVITNSCYSPYHNLNIQLHVHTSKCIQYMAMSSAHSILEEIKKL